MNDDERASPAPEPSLARLFDAERSFAEPPPSAVRARLARRLTPLQGPSPAAPSLAANGGPSSALVKAASFLATGVVVGALGHAALAPTPVEVRYVDRVVAVAADGGAPVEASPGTAPTAGSVLPIPPVMSTGIGAGAGTNARSSGTHPSMTAPPPSPEELGRERALIEAARSAVARRDGASALAAIDRHATVFPAGQLVEERSALAVQALALAERRTDARSRADQFRKRYPKSVFLPIVENALQQLGE